MATRLYDLDSHRHADYFRCRRQCGGSMVRSRDHPRCTLNGLEHRLLYFQLNRLSPFNELHGHHVKFDRPFNAGHLVSANIVLCPTFCIFYRMLFVLSIRKYYWLLFFFGSVTDILVALIGVKCCMIVHIDPGQIFSPLRRYPRAPKCEFFCLNFGHLTANV